MRYSFAMVHDQDVQRRPEPGVRWVRTPAFVKLLKALLDEKTSVAVAAEVSEAMQYKIDDSLIRKLKSDDEGELPTSIVIGPLCRLYGWPVPPVADANLEWATASAGLYELQKLAPDRFGKLIRLTMAEVHAGRAEAEVVSEVTVNPDDSKT